MTATAMTTWPRLVAHIRQHAPPRLAGKLDRYLARHSQPLRMALGRQLAMADPSTHATRQQLRELLREPADPEVWEQTAELAAALDFDVYDLSDAEDYAQLARRLARERDNGTAMVGSADIYSDLARSPLGAVPLNRILWAEPGRAGRTETLIAFTGHLLIPLHPDHIIDTERHIADPLVQLRLCAELLHERWLSGYDRPAADSHPWIDEITAAACQDDDWHRVGEAMRRTLHRLNRGLYDAQLAISHGLRWRRRWMNREWQRVLVLALTPLFEVWLEGVGYDASGGGDIARALVEAAWGAVAEQQHPDPHMVDGRTDAARDKDFRTASLRRSEAWMMWAEDLIDDRYPHLGSIRRRGVTFPLWLRPEAGAALAMWLGLMLNLWEYRRTYSRDWRKRPHRGRAPEALESPMRFAVWIETLEAALRRRGVVYDLRWHRDRVRIHAPAPSREALWAVTEDHRARTEMARGIRLVVFRGTPGVVGTGAGLDVVPIVRRRG